jgi:glycerate kinase
MRTLKRREHRVPAAPLYVLIAPDKFKGTLSASQAASAIAAGWRQGRPQDRLELLPISDGGDGFGEMLSRLLGGKEQKIKTIDAAHRPCTSSWWWQQESKLAIVESARVIGLAMLPPRKFHPFELDTFGLGEVLRAVSRKGAKRCFVGIGGSATNDGGFGMARALGWQFLDNQKEEITQWTELEGIEHIRPPKNLDAFHTHTELIVAVDVQNPLLGVRGATRVYGPQKGMQSEQFAQAERCLRRMARIAAKQFGQDVAKLAGAGAAGGLGFGLMAFANARVEGGFELFARCVELNRRLGQADLVITGEGAVDDSTLMGKGVGALAGLCSKRKIPCICLAGSVRTAAKLSQVFARVRGLTELTSAERARTEPTFWLKQLSAKVAASFAGQF